MSTYKTIVKHIGDKANYFLEHLSQKITISKHIKENQL